MKIEISDSTPARGIYLKFCADLGIHPAHCSSRYARQARTSRNHHDLLLTPPEEARLNAIRGAKMGGEMENRKNARGIS